MTAALKPLRQTLTLHDTVYETVFTRKFAHRKPYAPKDPSRLTAIIPGLILQVLVAPGDTVRPGQSLLILEAMKMQNHITAHDYAVVQALHAAPGDTVTKGQLLVAFE
jgi:biotin carboxyl carrier protein